MGNKRKEFGKKTGVGQDGRPFVLEMGSSPRILDGASAPMACLCFDLKGKGSLGGAGSIVLTQAIGF